MQNSTPFFKRQLANVRTGVVAAFFIVALIGFADATFLTVEHYRGVIPPCTTAGCDTVLSSSYSIVAGIPVSLLGALYYLVVVIGSFIYLESQMSSGTVGPRQLGILKWSLFATVAGLIASLYFIALQAFVIHSWCQYCIGSAITSTILFVIAICIIRKNLR
jgi:uncharacterized membrane protein